MCCVIVNLLSICEYVSFSYSYIVTTNLKMYYTGVASRSTTSSVLREIQSKARYTHTHTHTP